MSVRTSQLALSRRVCVYFVLFCLTALAWLAVGVGWLLVSVPDRDGWIAIMSVAPRSPVAFLAPLLVIGLGAWMLRRTVAPAARIESQLEAMPLDASRAADALQPIPPSGTLATAWNLLVEILHQGRAGDDLNTRLDQALKGYRQQRSNRILNSLTDGIAVTDQAGRISFANKSLSALLGKAATSASLLGQTMEQCLGLDCAGDEARALLDPRRQDCRLVAEISHSPSMPSGVYRIARSPQCGDEPGSTVPGNVWCVRDVTPQKLADRMRDEFVSSATHELRTPLANIKAHAEAITLCDAVDVEQQKIFCNTIDDEVSRLARFVDDLLDLSRMEAGSTSLNPQVTDMERLLAETVDKTRADMEQTQLTFEQRLPAKLPELVVDKDKIVVALFNLLGNAAKYTPAGGRVRLHVELTDTALLIHVEDTGIGISQDEQAKIFEKFFRSSDARVHEKTGSGLGLSLTNEIVRLHGGRLTVHSELNKGSRFTVQLPLTTEVTPCSTA